MTIKLIEIIIISAIYGYTWVWVSFGLNKLKITDWLFDNMRINYCAYCCSFWIGGLLVVLYQLYELDLYVFLIPVLGSTIANIQLKRHYEQ